MRQQRASPYDLIVYHLGVAPCHDDVWPCLLRHPGLVVLHDDNLHDARARMLLAQGRADGLPRRSSPTARDPSGRPAPYAAAGESGRSATPACSARARARSACARNSMRPPIWARPACSTHWPACGRCARPCSTRRAPCSCTTPGSPHVFREEAPSLAVDVVELGVPDVPYDPDGRAAVRRRHGVPDARGGVRRHRLPDACAADLPDAAGAGVPAGRRAGVAPDAVRRTRGRKRAARGSARARRRPAPHRDRPDARQTRCPRTSRRPTWASA